METGREEKEKRCFAGSRLDTTETGSPICGHPNLHPVNYLIQLQFYTVCLQTTAIVHRSAITERNMAQQVAIGVVL